METERMTLSFEMPRGSDPFKVIRAIAEEDGDDSGLVRIDGEDMSWDISGEGGGVEIDRRQRLAAALLIMGFDLPQEMRAAARNMMEAARICPGLHTGEIGGMGGQSRTDMLRRARDIVDEMLSEG